MPPISVGNRRLQRTRDRVGAALRVRTAWGTRTGPTATTGAVLTEGKASAVRPRRLRAPRAGRAA